jgi:hypothetical protein
MKTTNIFIWLLSILFLLSSCSPSEQEPELQNLAPIDSATSVPTVTQKPTKAPTLDAVATLKAEQESLKATEAAIKLSQTPTKLPTVDSKATLKVEQESFAATGTALAENVTPTLPPATPTLEPTATNVPPTAPPDPTATSTSLPPTATATQPAADMCQSDMYTCSDLPGSQAQEIYNMCMPINGDIHKLDENNNGIACEDGGDFNVPVVQSTEPPPTEPPAPSPSNVVITSVNKRDEFVDIANNGGSTESLSGWNLVSEKGNQQCPLYGEIAAGQSIRVYAKSSDSGLGGINCGHGKNIWNNSDSDPAVLYNASGQEVSRR